MDIALELVVEARNSRTGVYCLEEVRPNSGPRALQVEYRCDSNLTYPGDESIPRKPDKWEVSGAAADAIEAKLAALQVRVVPEFALGLDGNHPDHLLPKK